MYVYRLSVKGWAGEMSPVATNDYFLGALNGHFFIIYITDILLLSPHVATTCPPLQ